MTTPTTRPLLVLGGGIAGLGAADEARRNGRAVIVVERDATVGGMLRTDRREGFSFNRGGHRFITSLPWVQERLTALLGDRLAVRTRRSLVLLDGTTVQYPLQFDDLVRRLGVRTNLRALTSYLAARGRARRAAGNEEKNRNRARSSMRFAVPLLLMIQGIDLRNHLLRYSSSVPKVSGSGMPMFRAR